jgi:rhodanese-related sulfurtransferase
MTTIASSTCGASARHDAAFGTAQGSVVRLCNLFGALGPLAFAPPCRACPRHRQIPHRREHGPMSPQAASAPIPCVQTTSRASWSSRPTSRCPGEHEGRRPGLRSLRRPQRRGPREGACAGRISLPHRGDFDREALFVVYCAGSHCNGADKAALRLANLRRPVTIMIGGMIGWADEKFAVETNWKMVP